MRDGAPLREHVKFPPLGRVVGRAPPGAHGFVGPLSARRNAVTLAIAMIETREALASLDAILASRNRRRSSAPRSVDRAPSRRRHRSYGAEVDRASRVAARAAHGKFAGCTATTAKRKALRARLPLRSVSSDLNLLRAAARAELAAAR